MKFSRFIILVLLSIMMLSLTNCISTSTGEMEIIPVDSLSRFRLKNNKTIHRTEYYLIRNYTKNDSIDLFIDQFICENINRLRQTNHSSYHGSFYKESWIVNLDRIKRKDNTISMFGTNISTYTWDKSYGITKCIACKDDEWNYVPIECGN